MIDRAALYFSVPDDLSAAHAVVAHRPLAFRAIAAAVRAGVRRVYVPDTLRDTAIGAAVEASPRARATVVWLKDGDASLEYLGELWSGIDRRPERTRLLDDMWAAAQHHAFRYAYLLARTAEGAEERSVLERARRAWRDLPMALRFAVDSARRGRHRATLVVKTFTELRRIEAEADAGAERS